MILFGRNKPPDPEKISYWKHRDGRSLPGFDVGANDFRPEHIRAETEVEESLS